MSSLDPDRLQALVSRDIDAGLGEFFTPADGGLDGLSGLEVGEEPIASATRAAVPWQYEARHDGSSFAGIPPTGRDVTVRGVTIVEQGDGEEVFRRFVDWLDLLEQLGAVLVTRPVVDAFPGEDAFRDRFGLLHAERPEPTPED